MQSTDSTSPASSSMPTSSRPGFARGLGLFDSTMVVIGIMVGSGIFIVPAEMARLIASPGWLLVAWAVTGVLTVTAGLAYGELAAMIPEAGGMYVYLREAFSPLLGFLYGWTLWTVIQTGTLAAVAIAFARFAGVLFPSIGEEHYLVAPIHITTRYAVSLSTAQLLGIVVILLLTYTNSRGLQYGRIVQNIFTVAKIGALLALILLGCTLGVNHAALAENFHHFWTVRHAAPFAGGLSAASSMGLFLAICIAQTGSLFSADSWHDITFVAAEVKEPHRNLPLALGIGTSTVIMLYLLANVAYLLTLPLTAIQHAPADRVATAALQTIFPLFGAALMAIAIMVSTFGTVNAMTLAGARVYYAMAWDGLFFRRAGNLNRARVPGWALWIQGIWSCFLILPRTFNTTTRHYGNLYSDLLDYVISAALIFYILTIAGVLRLRKTRPNAPRPYRVFGYPWLPLLYIAGASVILIVLFLYRPTTTWPGLAIVVAGLPLYWLMRARQKASGDVHR
ncbi:MAG TPA: amino acid permease [Acidobacteriaceae bacterium]|nr:amino acid permease [Acidobacteriaceae bacterium]